MVRCGSKQPYEPLSVCTIFIRRNDMLILFEGLICCLIVLLSCVIGIANGPVNMVFFYDQKVQDKVVELGLTDKDRIRRNCNIFKYCGILPYFVFVVISVYFINKARGFLEPFIQMTVILFIEGIFDRIFIDWYWVNHTKAWDIEGTEDLKPYIDNAAMMKKCIGTIIGFPLIAAMLSFALRFIIK